MRSNCDSLQCTLETRHTDRDDMQFKGVFLVALISVHIHIPCPELSCFTVTVFQNFRFECKVYILFM